MGAELDSVDTERRIRMRLADVTVFLTDDRCTDKHRAEIDKRLGAVMEIVDMAKAATENA
jgi:hypothetical protein